MFYYRAGSAASFLNPLDLSSDYISQAKFLHLTGITPALSAGCSDTIHAAIEIAHQSGVKVSFDPNIRFKLWPAQQAKEELLNIIPKTHILLTSKEEAAFLTEETDTKFAAKVLLAMGPEQVIIKLGAEGAYARTSETETLEPGIKVQVVETVGAGDAFNAGYLSGQLRGLGDQRISSARKHIGCPCNNSSG